MTKRMGVVTAMAALMIGVVLVSESLSQQGRRGFDPARMTERFKETLGATDEEWKVIEPKLTKVATLTFEARIGGALAMFGRGRGGEAAASRPAPTSDTGKAAVELAKVLADKEAKGEQIKTALQGLRDARAKAKLELEQAQKDLREVLTIRQEAMLVTAGMLE